MFTFRNSRIVPHEMPAVSPGIARARRFVAVAMLAGLALLAAGCSARPPLQSANPQVQAARQACQDTPDEARYACIEQQAIATLDPDICRLLGIAEDDACLQAVYEAADEPAICDRLYLPGIVPTCQAYYADPNHAPLMLTPTKEVWQAVSGSWQFTFRSRIVFRRVSLCSFQCATTDL